MIKETIQQSINPEDYYTMDNIVELFKEFHVNRSAISRSIKENRVPYISIEKALFGANYYFPKKIIDEQYKALKGCVRLNRDFEKRFNISCYAIRKEIASGTLNPIKLVFQEKKFTYIKIKDVEAIKREIDQRHLNKNIKEEIIQSLTNPEDYYTINDAVERLKEFSISRKALIAAIKENRLSAIRVTKRTIESNVELINPSRYCYYILKEHIDEQYKLLKNSLSIKQIEEKYGINKYAILSRIRKTKKLKTVPLAFKYELYINEKDIQALIEEWKIKETIKSFNTHDECIDYLFKDFKYNKQLEKTIDVFIKYSKSYIKKSGSQDDLKRVAINRHKRVLAVLLKNCSKEIFEHTDMEMNELYKIRLSNIPTRYKAILAKFFRYCQQHYKIKCKFAVSYIVKIKEGEIKDKESIYSLEVWKEYFLYLTDIDKHIERAFEDDKYANFWLYTLLHLTLFWRKVDITQIGIENIDFNLHFNEMEQVEWYIKNKIDLALAQNIIDGIYISNENLQIQKTKAQGNMVIALPFLIPVAIAFIALNKCRKTVGRTTLFRNKYNFAKNNFQWFFEGKEELKEFQSRRANRSLSTYAFETANRTEGMAFLAYSLNSNMRSHKRDIQNFTNVTATYILTTNNDGSVNDVCHNLFLRGHFGYLYHLMVEIVYGNIEELNLAEVTKLIVSVKERYSPKEMELVAEYALQPINVSDDDVLFSVKELLKYSKEELKVRLNALFRGELPSKTQNIQCVIYPKCVRPVTCDNCFGCPHSLPTVYVLKDIQSTLFYLFNKYYETDENNVLEITKYKKMIEKLMMIIALAKVEFSKHQNSNYIDTLIDMNEITKHSRKIIFSGTRREV